MTIQVLSLLETECNILLWIGIHLDEASITNRPAIIARNKKVVAINSAVQVDLTGQVCADSVGTRLISGIGGQLDFEQGAAMSEGGIPIICLPSLSKSGESTIVNTLTAGAGVTTTRYHAHWIVTEYGATNLWGLDMQKRARELINLAHPSKREQLAREAHERYGIII
jgi:acyl-CoA hydrolase